MLFVAIVSTCVVSKVLIIGCIVRECEDLFYLGLDLVCPSLQQLRTITSYGTIISKTRCKTNIQLKHLALEGFPSLPFRLILNEAIDSSIKSFSLLVLLLVLCKIKPSYQDQNQDTRARPSCLTLLINSLIILISVKSKQPTL